MTVAYNRDQRIANRIIDVLAQAEAGAAAADVPQCGLSTDVVCELCAQGQSPYVLSDYVRPRIIDVMALLLNDHAIRREDDIDGARYFIGDLPRVLEVARGKVL